MLFKFQLVKWSKAVLIVVSMWLTILLIRLAWTSKYWTSTSPVSYNVHVHRFLRHLHQGNELVIHRRKPLCHFSAWQKPFNNCVAGKTENLISTKLRAPQNGSWEEKKIIKVIWLFQVCHKLSKYMYMYILS